MTIPTELRKYFWDVNAEAIDISRHEKFVAERLLEFGDEAAITWLRRDLNMSKVKEIIANSRRLSRRSANFWTNIFGVPKDQVLCLKSSIQKRNGYWTY